MNSDKAQFTIDITMYDDVAVSYLDLGTYADKTGRIVEVPGAKVLDQNGLLMALVPPSFVVSANGTDSATMLPVFSTIDFRGLAAFKN